MASEWSSYTPLVVLMTALSGVCLALSLPEPLPLEHDADSVPIWSIGEDQVQSIRLTRADDVIEATRGADDRWTLSQPQSCPAESAVFFDLAWELARIREGSPIDSERLQDFGLEPSSRVDVALGMRDGHQLTLAFGVDSPVGQYTYAQLPSGQLVSISTQLADRLRKRGDFYRSHALLDFDPAQVRSVAIQSEWGVLKVSQTETGWWLDGFGRANVDALDDLLSEALNLRFDKFLPGDSTSLDEPVFSFSLDREGAESIRLDFGRDTSLGTVAYSTDRGNGFIHTDSLKMLTRGPKDLAELRAFPFPPDDSLDVRLSVGGVEHSLTRLNGQWSSVDSSFPGEAVGSLLSAAQVFFVADPPSSVERVRGSVSWVEEGHSAEIQWGSRGRLGYVNAQDSRGGRPFLISDQTLSALTDLL